VSSPAAEIRVVPANAASCDDIRAVFGERGVAATCQCQWFKIRDKDWAGTPLDVLAHRLRGQTRCGVPDSPTTSGLVAYLSDQPVGWCAVESRSAYPRLAYTRVPWAGREEDPSDPGVWAITCFVVRVGYRRRGVSRALAEAAVEHARAHGARAVEGYPKQLAPGKKATWGELYVGTPGIFAAAGLREVSNPTPRRSVMRLDF